MADPAAKLVTKSSAELVAAARSQVSGLTPLAVATELSCGALLIDLRERDERVQSGRIAGAVHVPRGLLEFAADPGCGAHHPELLPSRRVVLHCGSGGRSALAAATLLTMGYESVVYLEGGFAAWKAAGLPVVSAGSAIS